jgi:hypothetical protein
MDSQVHIAGPTLRVGNVRRQRCVWCGALLEEYDLTRVSRALEPGEPASWEVGELVRLSGTFPRAAVAVEATPHAEDADAFAIPDDSCMALSDAVTV